MSPRAEAPPFPKNSPPSLPRGFPPFSYLARPEIARRTTERLGPIWPKARFLNPSHPALILTSLAVFAAAATSALALSCSQTLKHKISHHV
ncbi:hypothetical protein CDAR_220751 [Caerostris darwini]|uniref:Uncharacterized protein n=1 Tax=Caerostris darwini TaxID=1538125 RepID=A0AAV4PE28_9ARAC|nr:hypothetical protein CDAR_220751 [Caerostris darwini]